MSSVTISDGFQHLPFQVPRASPWGLVDGMFVATATHPGSGDLADRLLLTIPFQNKADWIYVLQGIQVQRQVELNTTWFIGITLQSGPAIKGTFLQSMAWSMSGSFNQTISGAFPFVSFPNVSTGEILPAFKDLLLWGDKTIVGDFQVAIVDMNKAVVTNIDFTLMMWGWMVKQQTFFRGVLPGLA